MIVITKVSEEAKVEGSEEATIEGEEVEMTGVEVEEADSKTNLRQVRWHLASKYHFKLTTSRWKLRIKVSFMLILSNGENILMIAMSF